MANCEGRGKWRSYLVVTKLSEGRNSKTINRSQQNRHSEETGSASFFLNSEVVL